MRSTWFGRGEGSAVLDSRGIDHGTDTPVLRTGVGTAGLPRLRLHLPARFARPQSPQLIDIVVAAAVAVLVAVDVAGTGSVQLTTAAVAAVGPLCLVWRRAAPLPVLLLTAVAFYGYSALVYPHRAVPLAVLVALYTVAATSGALVAALASTVLLASLAALETFRSGWRSGSLDDLLIAHLLSLGAACTLGYAVQLTRARTQLLSEQAERLAARHAAHEERMLQSQRDRIARDLHDIVAHQVSVITALAAGAGQVLDSQPGRARTALASIEAAGREALVEMRRLLRVLRAEDQSLHERTPQPGLIELDALASRAGEAGVPVEITVTGPRRPLTPGVELCAYRIVQEALTNVLKHAAPARAQIDLEYRPGGVAVQISDDGPGLYGGPTTGHGLIGMRERCQLLNGELTVDSGPGRGVRVRAWLPDVSGP